MLKRNISRDGEAGWVMIESMGSLLFYLIMIAAGAILIGFLMSGGKLSETEQAISALRMGVQQLYSGTGGGYPGLTNTVVLNAGIVPERLNGGSTIVTPWGGNITLATGTSVTNSFTMTIDSVPKSDCTKLATFQLDAWVSAVVNSTSINQSSSVSDAASACAQDYNTIVWTSH